MATNREEIELAFNIEMETRKALGAVSKIDKSLKSMVTSRLKIKDFDSKSLHKFREEAAKTRKNLHDIAKSMSPKNRADLDKDFKAVGKSYRNLSNVIFKEKHKVRALEKTIEKEEKARDRRRVAAERSVSQADTKESKKAAGEQLDLIRQEIKAAKEASAAKLVLTKKSGLKAVRQARTNFAGSRSALNKRMVATGSTADLEKRGAKAKQAQEFVEGIRKAKAGAEMAGGFKDSISALKGKDIFGLGKAGYKMSAGLLKGVAQKSMTHGAGLAAAGAAKGGMVGKSMQGIGKAMQGIAPLLGSLSKLAPILGLVGGAIMGLIKLFLDADAAVKDMNKTVLEGASTWDIYSSQGKDVGLGLMHLDDVLGKVRDQTTDFKMNMKMGTTAKDHQQFINTLTREGISLQHIDSTLEENKKNLDTTNVSMKKYTDISSMAIGYSRLFGVSLDEISQFSGEMMRDLGSSLNDVSEEFNKIGNAADSAGMAQNKFFAILRGVSSDMGLYGVRVEEVTKMLGQLGKVMSPRSAEKYMKTFAQGMKGTSVQDRLKTMLLGGPKAIKEVQQDISRQTDDMVKKFQDTAGIKDAGTAKAILAGKTIGGVNLKGLEKAGKLGGAKSSDLQEQYQDLAMSGEQAKHGAYGAAMASENMTGYGAMKAKRAGMGGGSFLGALKGNFAEHQKGVLKAGGEENLKAFAHIEMAINQQKEAMLDAAENPSANPELIKYLKKIKKYDESNTKEAKEANKRAAAGLTEDELWASLDEKNAAAEKTDAQKMLDAAKEQGQRTMDIVTALSNIFDTLFNYIYQILTDIYSALKFGGSMQKRIYKSQNKELVTAWKKSGGDMSKYMGELSGSATMQKMVDTLSGEAKTPEDKKKKEDLTNLIAEEFKKNHASGDAGKDLDSVVSMAKLSPEKAKAVADVQKKYAGGGGDSGARQVDLRTIIKEAKLTSAESEALLSNAAKWATSAEGRTNITEGASKILGTGGSPAVNVPAQQQATAAAANPGSGGGAVAVSAPAPSPAATPTASGAGPAATPGGVGQGPNKIPTVPDEQKMNAAVLDQVDFTGAAVVGSLQDLWNALRMKGIKFDRTQLEGLYQDVIHKGTYLGAQDALAEYALYTASDPSGVLKKMKDSGFQGVGKLATTLEGQMDEAKKSRTPGNAAGGLVTGISGGMAQISPAAGEGLASIGRGERILPAGGGGGGASISLTVNGIGGQDLANFLKEKVNQGIHEYKRREKFT